MSKRDICLKGRTDLKKAISHLEDLVSSLKAGTICLQNGHEMALTLHPESTVEMQIEASQRHGKEAVMIDLSWRKPQSDGDELPLRITATEPQESVEEQ